MSDGVWYAYDAAGVLQPMSVSVARAALLSEQVEELREERNEARRLMGPASYGFKDGVYTICLGYHEETEEYPGAFEWLEVVPLARVVTLESAAKALRQAQRAYMLDRGNEALGRAVAEAAQELDRVLEAAHG